MKKIAIFQENLTVGGIQKSLINLLNNLDYSKVSVDCYVVNDVNFYTEGISKKVKLKKLIALPKICKYLPFFLVKYFYNPKIYEKYDVTIDFSSYSQETAIAAIKTKSDKKYIMCHDQILERMKHEIKYKYLVFMNKEKYKYFDSVIAVSKNSLNEFNTYFKKDDSYILPNIVDDKVIKELKKEVVNFKVDKKYINVVSLGRFTHAKGYDLLLDIFRKLKRTDMRLYLIGSGEDFDKITLLVKKYNLEDRVFLLGKIANPFPYLAQMDLYVGMSRYEGQGMAFIEAYALGLPVIIPKHLEKTQDIVKATKDIKKALEKFERTRKTSRSLKEYNREILDKFYKIIGE